MKARNGLLALLVSVMMVFTMMPMSVENVYAADTTPPEINADSLTVSISGGKEVATVGDTVTVSVEITDEVGIRSAMMAFYKPESQQTSASEVMEYNSETGKYERSFTVTDQTESGIWKVSGIIASDNNDNFTSLINSQVMAGPSAVDLSAGDFTVEMPCINGHTLSEPIKENEIGATCDKDGSYDEVVYCSVCKKEISREKKKIAAVGHSWNNEPTVDKPATCTEEGSQSVHCARCNETQEAAIIPPMGHQWNTTYTVDVPATESAAGSQSIHCSVCGAIKEGSSVTIPQLAPSTPTVPAEIMDLPTVKISKPKVAKKKITVKWKKVSKKNQKKIGGIQIQVASDPGFTNIVKTATAGKKKTFKVIKGLKPKTKYYVRIRAYAAGNHISAWRSKSAKVK